MTNERVINVFINLSIYQSFVKKIFVFVKNLRNNVRRPKGKPI